ncbi:TrkA C-terminal domain-containing protein [Clostridium manihotivorum]|uniref:GntR family transcriptional regulator n=1 Tax=Clostridium manihotivorum TaxID=2320868 RepID=A0A3R5QT43_9CLOT|nr:TrkA C-terminal domain-containing protein [Clostridium manihotivorum]QAA31865.1 GntR family transcriptional regulator [Clostridium manihotivorum]
MENNIIIPVYQRIAIDIANKINSGKLAVGERLFGRSILASEYNVSPETIRRAIKLLEDVDIVESTKGSGVLIISRENAFKYISRFSNIESVKDLKIKINNIIEEKRKLDSILIDSINKIEEYSSKLKDSNPMVPVEVEVPDESSHIGKTISELKFWQNTGGTVVGIKRNGSIVISPGPYALITKDDILLVIGDENIMERVVTFLKD